MTDEHAQLRSYVEYGAQYDFSAIVHRYLPLVYAAALRRLNGDAHRAQDVTQLVFIALARNAAALSRHPDLTGWLFTTTRFLAAKTQRTEHRRQSREQAAQVTLPEENLREAESPPVRRLLDDAVAELKTIDRQVILLRFHRGLRLAEIGAQLGVTENAVQKRLDRALEVLKQKLSQRRITSTAAALALALEQQSAVAVPAGLAAASTTAALACGAGAAGLPGALSLMALSKLQLGLAAAAVVAGSAGWVWEHREVSRLHTAMNQQTVAAGTQLAELRKQVDVQSKRADAAESDVAAMLQAMQTAGQLRPAGAPAAVRLTSTMDFMKSASARANQLRKEGRLQEALAEYVRCYQELRRQRTSGVEGQLLMAGIVSLSRAFPPAIAALRELRDTSLREFQANPTSRELASEVALLNERLGEGNRTVALYDTLSPDSPLRQTFGAIAHTAFVESRRYADALIGKSYGSMLNDLDMGIRVIAFEKTPGQVNVREALAQSTAANIEVLIGTGQRDEARALTNKLLTFDNSPATRAIIEAHVARASQPPGQ